MPAHDGCKCGFVAVCDHTVEQLAVRHADVVAQHAAAKMLDQVGHLTGRHRSSHRLREGIVPLPSY